MVTDTAEVELTAILAGWKFVCAAAKSGTMAIPSRHPNRASDGIWSFLIEASSKKAKRYGKDNELPKRTQHHNIDPNLFVGKYYQKAIAVFGSLTAG
jgi:hypothetical protein